MIIVGLGGILKDAACAVIKDGRLVAAIEERKVSRGWEPGQMPIGSILECLRLANASPADVDCIAIVRPFSTRPEVAFHLQLRSLFPSSRLVLVEHQTAHAASAYYASGLDHATVLTLDRFGDLRCGARFSATGIQLRVESEYYYPDSIGDLYSRVTELLGFQPGADEHKVQWLSTSGGDRFAGLFEEALSNGSGRIDESFFDANRQSYGGFSAKFYDRAGIPDGAPVPDKLKADVARGLQIAVERTVAELAGDGENLCLAGGLFYNALLVAALERSGRWKNVFVQPVAGNAGTALGAAFYAWHGVLKQDCRVSSDGLLLGPSYTAEEVKRVLENCKLRFRYLLTTAELIETAIRHIRNHQIIAWMQGRMEFGPRALGNRSILASPLDPYSTENLNAFIKHREAFRKFAASVPAELASEYFEVGSNARFLATVGRVREPYRKTFESAVLGDGYVRVHLVEESENPLYHKLLQQAGKANGVPVLYNTSFNLFGDPLVCTPRDAVRSFYSSGIDALFAGNFVLQK
jgi:carbamoyltransferase